MIEFLRNRGAVGDRRVIIRAEVVGEIPIALDPESPVPHQGDVACG